MPYSYKTILVLLNDENFAEDTMEMAAYIARQYDSHVIGLYVIPSQIIYTAPYGYGGPIIYAEATRIYKSRSSKIEDAFREFVRKQGLSGEWRQVDSDGHYVSETVVEHVRESDLIILGHDTSIKTLSPPDVEFYSYILKSSGRPVLITPNIYQKSLNFKEAIIGWDGSREAARATFDSIPLLKMADHTIITSFNPKKEEGVPAVNPGKRLADSLSRHDISAECRSERTRKRVSRALVDRAKVADLLVIGGYTHSRLRENIFGGVTRHVLSEMPCAVLLSH